MSYIQFQSFIFLDLLMPYSKALKRNGIKHLIASNHSKQEMHQTGLDVEEI